MFEEEAQQYAENKDVYGLLASISENLTQYDFGTIARYDIDPLTAESFKDGAEFGYNKANEWHYPSKGEYPKENKFYFVSIKDNGLAIAYFNGLHWETKYNLGDFEYCVETVIAWCELPEPPKGE